MRWGGELRGSGLRKGGGEIIFVDREWLGGSERNWGYFSIRHGITDFRVKWSGQGL